nr:MAG TPA: Cytosine specific methyltransferase [Bacteriophage sp.]
MDINGDMIMYNKKNPLRCFFAFEGYNSQGMALDKLKERYTDFDWVCVGRSEIDKYAILAANAVYPQYADRNYGDISKIDWNKVPDFDLLTYSFPCQDISNAGLQRGLEEGSGTRSGLLWECRRTIKVKRPKYLLMENVKGLTSDKFMPYLRKWLSFLESMGYSNFTKVLNSKDYGVPQNRERVFVVSILGDERYYFPKPFKLEKRLKDVLESNVDERYYLSKKIINTFIKRNKKNEDCDNYVKVLGNTNPSGNGMNGNVFDEGGVCPTLTTNKGEGIKIVQYGNKREQNLVDSGKISGDKVEYIDAYNQSVSDLCGTIRTTIDTSCMMFVTEPKSCAMRGRNPENPSDRNPGIPTEQRIEMGGDVANCLTTVQKDSLIVEPMFLGYTRDDKGKVSKRHLQSVCNTIHGSTGSGGNTDCFVAEPIEPSDENRKRLNDLCVEVEGDVTDIIVNPNSRKLEFYGYKSIKDVNSTLKAETHDAGVVQNYRIRKLTPRECFRLMGVSEENIDKIQKAAISKSQQYKMAGNSIVVDVLYHIFRKLFTEKECESKQLSLF